MSYKEIFSLIGQHRFHILWEGGCDSRELALNPALFYSNVSERANDKEYQYISPASCLQEYL